MEKLRPHCKDFDKKFIFLDFLNSTQKTQVLLKSDKNNGTFT
jgi:hypothetical protein